MPLQSTSGAATYDAFGSAAADRVYIEDVFSTYLYTGNQTARSIVNGIDLSTKGGMIWTKCRSAAGAHAIFDTNRGATGQLNSGSIDAAGTATDAVTGYNTNGYSLGVDNVSGNVNNNGFTFASWTFRKQPKFFDVVTYTGNGSNRTISHNLGSVPGCIIVKRTDTTADWQVYHRSLANTEYLVLNLTDAKATGTDRWNSTTATSTVFSLGTNAAVNANTGTYVAYLFAHDAGGFGLSGTDNVISCGSFVGNNSTPVSVTLGWETQWLLLKATNGNNWYMFDTMRGFVASPATSSVSLYPNLSDAEAAWNLVAEPTATGFSFTTNNTATFIYIAIRRGPMKVPTSGTSVFSPVARTGTGATAAVTTPGFPPDMLIQARRTVPDWPTSDRLRGVGQNLGTCYTTQETTPSPAYVVSYDMVGATLGTPNAVNGSGLDYIEYFFRRAPGFFDVVCYTGTGSATTFSHNLGVVPELMIVKKRSAADDWAVYANNDNTDFLLLNTTAATADDNTYWNDTSPTASVFTVGTNADVNTSAATYVAYLFATVAGVSKVGSYTGNGSNQTINCGFTGGSRFVLIKRTDSTGDWYVWDSARGIVSGNDPHLSLNDTAAEVTTDDSVDTDSTGFIVNQLAATNINVSSASYIFLAVA